jgi:hypothetical protein
MRKTAFSCPFGHYDFNRLLFGLSNSPTNFQRKMDVVLRNLVGTEAWIFIDDVVVFSKSAEELGNVLQRFDEANFPTTQIKLNTSTMLCPRKAYPPPRTT